MRRERAVRAAARKQPLTRTVPLAPQAVRACVPMEVMGLMLGEFVDDYTVKVVDVFAMPQVRALKRGARPTLPPLSVRLV